MSIHKIFAENLRTHCMRVGTIAEVCRNASVNRQQFNRYLSGAAIPNAGTLTRICKALEIEETELFKALNLSDQAIPIRTTKYAGSVADERANMSLVASRFIRSLDPHASESIATKNPGPPEAIYFCYFALQNFEQFLIRSVLSVRHVNGVVRFSRYTSFKSPSMTMPKLAFGKHRGIVYTDALQHHFIGVNRFAPYNTSLLSIDQKNSSQTNVSVGLGLMRASKGPFASRVCMEKLGSSLATARKAISRSGIVARDDSSVNPVVSSFFRPDLKGRETQLGIPSLEETMIGSYSQ